MIGRPPRFPLFPYATLFGSGDGGRVGWVAVGGGVDLAVEAGEFGGVDVGSAMGLERKAGQGGDAYAGELTSFHRQIRSEEHTSELQSQSKLVCRLLLEKKELMSSGSCSACVVMAGIRTRSWSIVWRPPPKPLASPSWSGRSCRTYSCGIGAVSRRLMSS